VALPNAFRPALEAGGFVFDVAGCAHSATSFAAR
jgi:hypothetical protein